MNNLLWQLLARLLACRPVRAFLIAYAKRTPYQHIMSADGGEMYMGRWWLLNPYNNETRASRWPWLPFSARIHHIMRADQDRDLHDHPWNARTIILDGWYTEQRLVEDGSPLHQAIAPPPGAEVTELIHREAGTSARLRHGEYHRIDEVSPGGVYTLFITSRYRGTWGFLVDGVKVPWRQYLGLPEAPATNMQQADPELAMLESYAAPVYVLIGLAGIATASLLLWTL